MSFPLYIADLTDATATTKLFDFNSYESSGLFLVNEETFTLGGDEFEETWLSAEGVDEDVLATGRRPHSRMEFDLHIMPGAVTFQDVRDELRVLNQALNTPGLIVCAPPGDGDTYYIDFMRSPLAAAYVPGDRRLFSLWTALASAQGLHVVINRTAKMRTALLAASVNRCHNATLAEDHDGDGVPSLWDWDSPTGLSAHAYDWGREAYTFGFALNGTSLFSQVISPASVGQVWTFAFEAALTSVGTDATARARIEFLDGSSSVIGSATDGTTPAVITSPVGGFGLAKVTATAPSTTASIRVSVKVTGSSTDANTIWVRKLQAEIGSAPSTFRAGWETVSMDSTAPFFKRLWVWGHGNIDGLVQAKFRPSTDSNVVRLAVSRRSGFRDSQESMLVFPGIRAVSATMLGGTSSQTDTAATSNAAAKTSLSAVYKKIIRAELLQVEETALRGKWRINAAVRAEVVTDKTATQDVYDIQCYYGLGDVTNLPFVMRHYELDTTEPAVSEYVVLDFGLVDVPPNSDGLFIELHARRASGAGQLWIDTIWPEPVDDQASLTYVPGHADPGQVANESWVGEDLVTPPANPTGLNAGELLLSGDMFLNDTDEAAQVPEVATAGLTAGVQHTFTVEGTMYNPGLTALNHGAIKVWDITTATQIVRAGITALKGQKWPAYKVSVKFTPAAGHAYSIYVRQSIDIADGNIHIQKISHSFIPPITGGGVQVVVLDGALRRAYVTESGMFARNLDHIPPFPSLEPGLQLVRVSTAEQAASGYDQVTSSGELVKHVPDTTIDVDWDQIPRWTS